MTLTTAQREALAAEFLNLVEACLSTGHPGSLTAHVDGRNFRRVEYKMEIHGTAAQKIMEGVRG